MKKRLKISIFILFITSIIIPILPVITVKAQDDPIVYRISTASLIVDGDWDPIVTDGYNILMGSYFYNAHEYLCGGYADYWGGTKGVIKEDEWYPILATSWETTFRPDNETNFHPLGAFNNTGGRLAIEFTLRENVTFHDGSTWNATVAKWNIDRAYLITGNLTGNANGVNDQRNGGTWWNEVVQTKDYWTESWNLTEYDAVDTLIYAGSPIVYPNVSHYAYYYLSDPDGPNPIIANNSNPYGGWDDNVKNFIHYSPYDQFPLVRWVEITEDLPSGGKIKVHWNSWNSYGMEGMWIPQISMQAYAAFNETGIYGYENGDDMIGTGPFKYVEHDEILDRGHMLKNENYWNKTALEADGWYDVDRYEVVQFPAGDIGKDARNIALTTHAVDYAYDSMTMPVDYDAIMANPNINYYEDYVSEYMTQITLNSINETWWSGGEMPLPWPPWTYNFSAVDINTWYAVAGISAEPAANGIPRDLRKALNYAFDYDTVINVGLNGRAVRAGGVTGVSNIFYNSSVPLADYDLEYARDVLLAQNGSDPYSLTQGWWPINFTQLLEARGLTDTTDSTNNNDVWQNIGKTNPIFKINFYWDEPHDDLKDAFELACWNLGCAISDDDGTSNRAPTGTILWDHAIGTYWKANLDGVHSIWSAQAWVMDYHMPMTIPEGWIHANYGDPSRGSWRDPFVQWPSETWPTWNFGFNYDSEIDYWLAVMYQSAPARKLETISKIANKEQNELYPFIWAYQTKGGEALWNNWDTFWVLDRDNRPAGFWGGISPHFLSYTPGTSYPLIPGVPLLITLTVSAASMLGIIYTLIKKKKFR